MPKLPPSMLTRSEQSAFTQWLRKLVAQTGMTRSQFASEMGDHSTARLTRYLDEGRVPTKEALLEIARVGGVPYSFACLKAGYFDEIVTAISEHARLAETTGEEMFKRAAFLLVFTVFPHGDDVRRELKQEALSKADIILDTLNMFSPKLDRLGRRARLQRPEPSGSFAVAVDILLESRLDAALRRRVAATILRDWAYRLDAKTAEAVRQELLPLRTHVLTAAELLDSLEPYKPS